MYKARAPSRQKTQLFQKRKMSEVSNLSRSDSIEIVLSCLRDNLEESLDLSNCYITDSEAQQLAEVLKHNNSLTSLNLHSNAVFNILIDHQMSDVGAIALAQALRYNTTLRDLCLSKQPPDDSE